MPRLQSVGGRPEWLKRPDADLYAAKFTGYQYGGRPLGLTFVKYQNTNGGDAMEDAEPTAGITQDQIM